MYPQSEDIIKYYTSYVDTTSSLGTRGRTFRVCTICTVTAFGHEGQKLELTDLLPYSFERDTKILYLWKRMAAF